MVRDFQAVIGEETRRQCQAAFGGKPDILLACVGGGSNAIGLFHEVCSPSSQPAGLRYIVSRFSFLQHGLAVAQTRLYPEVMAACSDFGVDSMLL